jgi:hypothetical protein
MSAVNLVTQARSLATVDDRKLGGTRRLVAALLLRQGLEEALEGFWLNELPGMNLVSHRAQLVSLRFYIDSELAGDVTYAWYRLSALCHHDAYELAPALAEIIHLAEIIEKLTSTPSMI